MPKLEAAAVPQGELYDIPDEVVAKLKAEHPFLPVWRDADVRPEGTGTFRLFRVRLKRL